MWNSKQERQKTELSKSVGEKKMGLNHSPPATSTQPPPPPPPPPPPVQASNTMTLGTTTTAAVPSPQVQVLGDWDREYKCHCVINTNNDFDDITSNDLGIHSKSSQVSSDVANLCGRPTRKTKVPVAWGWNSKFGLQSWSKVSNINTKIWSCWWCFICEIQVNQITKHRRSSARVILWKKEANGNRRS